MDLPGHGASARRRRLAQHLTCEPTLLLIGEAPGYQGARYSGVAFTSERLLLKGAIPRIERTRRFTSRERSFAEPSATIVWKKLLALGMHEDVVLWNAFPFHPHAEEEFLKNRTPTRDEVTAHASILEEFLALYPGVPIATLGTVSSGLVSKLAGERRRCKLRHPANGGATLFGSGLEAFARELGIARPQPTLLS